MITSTLIVLRARATDRRESGASAVEYGLLIAGIAAVIAAVIFALGGGSNSMFQKSCSTIYQDTATGSCD